MRASLTVAAFLGFPLLYFAAFPFLGATATLFAVIPIGATALLHGLRWGLVGGIATQAVGIALWQQSGVSTGDPVVRVGNGSGFIAVLFFAAGLGVLSDLNRRLRHQSSALEALRDAARAMSGAPARDDALAIILESALRVVPAEGGELWMPRDDNRELESVAANPSAWVGRRLSTEQSIAGRAFRTRLTQSVPDIRRDPEFVALDPLPRSIICVPIVSARRTLGVLALVSHEIGAFDRDAVRLLDAVAANAAGVIETADLVSQLRAGESRLRGVLENAPLLILATDRRGICTYAGGSRLEALWSDAESLVGQPLQSVFRVANPAVAGAIRDAIGGAAGEVAFTSRDTVFRLHYQPAYAGGSSGTVSGAIAVAVEASPSPVAYSSGAPSSKLPMK